MNSIISRVNVENFNVSDKVFFFFFFVHTRGGEGFELVIFALLSIWSQLIKLYLGGTNKDFKSRQYI
jgi:hypothetical protein